MFARIQTRYFRSLYSVDQALGAFHALVGPNASGKTSFLDVIGFLGDLVRSRGGVAEAVNARGGSFDKLTWMGTNDAFQLAVEAVIPPEIAERLSDENRAYDRVRYEIEVGMHADKNELGLNHETLCLVKTAPDNGARQCDLFPSGLGDAANLVTERGRGRKALITKKPGGNDNYYPEGKRASFKPSFKLGRARSALANLPAETEGFPAASWFRDLLEQGVKTFMLDSLTIRRPSPPGLGRRFQTDGANLPWVIEDLRRNDPARFSEWLAHVRTALEDIEDIYTVERPEDRTRYLLVRYANGAEVPSWLVSDGTLRLLALTIPAYLADPGGVFLIEEPENGVHPRAIETVVQSLSSMYRGQVLIATHSPVVLNMLALDQVLCFAKNESGATDIVSGDRHPALREWRAGEPDLGVLFASGILS